MEEKVLPKNRPADARKFSDWLSTKTSNAEVSPVVQTILKFPQTPNDAFPKVDLEAPTSNYLDRLPLLHLSTTQQTWLTAQEALTARRMSGWSSLPQRR
jgi:hypothetical protein